MKLLHIQRLSMILSQRLSSSLFEQVPVFKSNYSLEKIYPKSNSDIFLKKKEPSHEGEFTGHIPVEKLDISYSKSRGPGGQHVNTTNSKVTVKVHLESADWIPNQIRENIAKLHRNSINKDGYWQVRSDKTRDQHLNLADCMDKLRCYITEAAIPERKPSAETLELLRIRREKASEERLRNKRRRSLAKQEKNCDLDL